LLCAAHWIVELMVPSEPYLPLTPQYFPVLKGKVLGHARRESQKQFFNPSVVPLLQHAMPASAGWTNNNSSAAKATTATANIENNLVNDRLLGNLYNSSFIYSPLFFSSCKRHRAGCFNTLSNP
jgi:hypothetical protein